jgi:DNA-binding transcriptional MerR regulator
MGEHEDDRLLRRSEVAVMCGVTPGTVWRWEKVGLIRRSATTVGGHARYSASEARRVMAGGGSADPS